MTPCIKMLKKAKTACELSEQNIIDHFVDVTKMVEIGSGAIKEVVQPCKLM